MLLAGGGVIVQVERPGQFLAPRALLQSSLQDRLLSLLVPPLDPGPGLRGAARGSPLHLVDLGPHHHPDDGLGGVPQPDRCPSMRGLSALLALLVGHEGLGTLVPVEDVAFVDRPGVDAGHRTRVVRQLLEPPVVGQELELRDAVILESYQVAVGAHGRPHPEAEARSFNDEELQALRVGQGWLQEGWVAGDAVERSHGELLRLLAEVVRERDGQLRQGGLEDVLEGFLLALQGHQFRHLLFSLDLVPRVA